MKIIKNASATGTLVLLLVLFLSVQYCMALTPFGANLTLENSTTAPVDSPQSIAAQAGNVTEMNVFGYSTTQSWHGYYGNVTGAILLSDGSSNVMYNWSLASPQGEVYASRSNSISWSSVMCFNFTATGTYADDATQTGATSLYGMNLTQLEDSYNISYDDVDGVNETFFYNSGHDLFFTSNLRFNDSECPSAKIYDSSGGGVNDHFEEVLLYEYQSRSVIFTSLLEENIVGFDSRSHDFEMLVLEDGHSTDTVTTPYYFYVELE